MPTALITGGHGGVGLDAARALAGKARYNLLLAGRSKQPMEAQAEQLRKQFGVKVDTLELDLSSLASVRAAAAVCRVMLRDGRIDALQALLLNAGAEVQSPVSYSKDGYEQTFAVNCLGHFLLLNLLLDCVADNGRVVFTASGTHDPETMDGKFVGAAVEPDAAALAKEGKRAKALSWGKRYTTSKLCTMLYGYELDRRLRKAQRPVATIAFDPGFISETGLQRTAPKPLAALLQTRPAKWLSKPMGVTMGSLPFSGQALARVAADPAFSAASGKYFHANDGRLSEARSSRVSYDEARAVKLWSDSERLIQLAPEERPVCLV